MRSMRYGRVGAVEPGVWRALGSRYASPLPGLDVYQSGKDRFLVSLSAAEGRQVRCRAAYTLLLMPRPAPASVVLRGRATRTAQPVGRTISRNPRNPHLA